MTTTTPMHSDTVRSDRNTHDRRLTETKAGAKTTEFMLTVVFIAGVLIATYLDSDSLSRGDGWLTAAIVAAAYAISRGLAKAGVQEPLG